MPSQVRKVSASTDTVHAHTFPVDERMRVYAHVFEAIGQPLIVTDLTGSIVYWNERAETVFGKHRDEMVGRSVMAVADGDEWRLKITHVLTSLQKRTAKTPGVQRTLKTNRDGWMAKHTCA